MDLSVRANVHELMDAEDIDASIYRRCLSDLASVNRVTLTHRATLSFLSKATAGLAAGTELSILDVAFGHGDLLRAISTWAKKRSFKANLTGIDLNPRSAQAARAETTGEQNITYITGDVFGFAPSKVPDFIVTSQFTHHLADGQIIEFLKWLETESACGWHIADLHRHVIPYYGFRFLARVFGWHRIVRLDGTASIARAFTRADWERYLKTASVVAKISWHPLFRFGIGRIK
jgi:2-polyprenyl-3-methyl-5-hydroxy-6-metoxy-1,4-benzoquinol methylase